MATAASDAVEDVDATLQVSDKDDVEEDEGADDEDADSDEDALSAATGGQPAGARQTLQQSRLCRRSLAHSTVTAACMCQSSAPPHQIIATYVTAPALHALKKYFAERLISAAQSLLKDGFSPGAAAKLAAGNAGENGQKLNQAMRQAHNGKEAATAVLNNGP